MLNADEKSQKEGKTTPQNSFMSSHLKNSLARVPLPPQYKRNRKDNLLSEEEKRINHIISEQKRRHNIKVAYTQLFDLIPDLIQHQKSEANMLNEGRKSKMM
jgi:hypothetical protein